MVVSSATINFYLKKNSFNCVKLVLTAYLPEDKSYYYEKEPFKDLITVLNI